MGVNLSGETVVSEPGGRGRTRRKVPRLVHAAGYHHAEQALEKIIVRLIARIVECLREPLRGGDVQFDPESLLERRGEHFKRIVARLRVATQQCERGVKLCNLLCDRDV